MPGIFGLAGERPAAGAAALFAEMAGRLRHQAWYRESRHLDEPAGLALGRMARGFINPAVESAFNEDRSLLAMLDGEVYDYAEQRRALEAGGHVFRGDSPAELLLHGYESHGEDFFRELHGKFMAALWDPRGRR